MAEDESDQESERLVEELEAIADEELRGPGAGQLSSREYCRRFCEVVEDYTARWQVPLPQLQVLQTALCCFTSASVSFPTECEHVQCVLSRLALSLFELLLFFGKDEFYEAPLKDILGSVQECHDLLMRYDSTDLRLVTCVIKDGGPWEDPVLQAILKGKSEPQEIVDKYLRSENQLFFEFRVRYLIACERISEAVALITTCLSHPEVSKNLYYHQAYFICLHMTRLTDKLLPEHVLRIDCSDGVNIICNIEKEGKTALALQLSVAFLITQLQTGNMYCIWELIFIWSKLQLKVNPNKQGFIEQCYNMLRIATNVKVIFPFMKTIKEEIGECAVQLSVELCGCALQLDLQDDPQTKSLIYKTIAYLLPTDLEICRICALSVFFLERNIETYRVVERLYRYSDEDYNEFSSYVENRVRFELLPILKRGLLFDPEFWNFSMIQANCADLLGDEGALVLSNTDALVLPNSDALVLPNSALVLSNPDALVLSNPDALVLSNPDALVLSNPDALVLSNPDALVLSNPDALVLSNPDALVLSNPDALVLSNSDALDSVAEQQSLPLEGAVMPLHNGELKHKESSSRLRASSTPKKSHTVLTPTKVDTVTPRHHCTLCNRQFLGGHILRHAQTHQKGGWFSCVLCSRKFRNKVKMLRHLKHHLKKMQRHPAGNSLKASSDPGHMYLDRNEHSLEESPSSSETGNSIRDVLDHNRTIPGENHMVDHNGEKGTYSTATQTLFTSDVSNSNDTSALGETPQIDDAGKSLSQCIKLNGTLSCSEDSVGKNQVGFACPAQDCQRVFTKVRAMKKHARNAHHSDAKVQQHIMLWNKGKCRFCQRKFVNCRHFMDHLKLHFYPNFYFCPQLNCNKRFKLLTQLAEHQLSHEDFKLQCGFINCPAVFDQITSLHEHEAQHYEQIPVDNSTSLPNIELVEAAHVPQEDNGNLGQQHAMPLLSRKIVRPFHEEEALDLPIPIWKSRKDVAEPKTYKQADKKVNGEVHLPEQVLQADSNVPDPLPEDPAAEEQNLNGHTAEEPSVVVETQATVDNDTETVITNPPCSDSAEETPPTNITTESEQTPSKPNASTSAFGPSQARPYRRPLPPTYLAEQYLCMPKRRKNELTYTSENPTESKAPGEKFRCGKCLTNYCSSEALEQHLAQKKCQLYFGFDSDDESAW